MSKVDKKNKKDNEEKDFAHVVISWYSTNYLNTSKKHWKINIFGNFYLRNLINLNINLSISTEIEYNGKESW